jgi:Arc/MetJ-type ribon-helix-helix transcriptional regulator
VKARSRVVTFRMDQATWDYMRALLPFTKYRKASPFIREGIELLLKQEEEQPSGWRVGRPRRL